MIVAGMATMPTRRETFMVALKSILPQVDRLILFLDRFETVPDLRHPKIVVFRSQEFGDLRAHGKFLGLLTCHGPTIYFGIDDDISYPPDYVTRMRSFLAAQSRPSVVGVHGCILNAAFDSYLRDRRVADIENALNKPVLVDVLATCTVAFDTSILRFDARLWKPLNMDDLHFSLKCAQLGIRRVAIPRQRVWLRRLARSRLQPDSIYGALLKDDRQETELARNILQLSGRSVSSSPAPSVVDPTIDPTS